MVNRKPKKCKYCGRPVRDTIMNLGYCKKCIEEARTGRKKGKEMNEELDLDKLVDQLEDSESGSESEERIRGDVHGVFYCHTCLCGRDPANTSPDPRYCQGCYDLLRGEVESRGSFVVPKWSPAVSGTASFFLGIEAGDRVQFLHDADNWSTVVEFIPPSTVRVGDSGVTVAIGQVKCHIKGEENMKNESTSPQENLKHAREVLSDLEKREADPRAIGLWRSKVLQVERLCTESGKVVPESVVKANNKNSKNGKGSTTTKPKTGPGLHPCVCGCEGVASSGRNFLPGHDSKFAGMIRRLDAGKVQLDELPESVRNMVGSDHELVLRARKHNKG